MSAPYLISEHHWRSHPGNVQQAREAAREVIQQYAVPEPDLLELAVGEACANAVEHGSPKGEASEFTLRCLLMQDQPSLIFEVEDEGKEFNLKGISLANLPDRFSEGGRGLFLINAIMDEVALFSTSHGLNIRMCKCLL
jgi:anti-sigma regulatory factor (Ser/Thr protein kinase)